MNTSANNVKKAKTNKICANEAKAIINVPKISNMHARIRSSSAKNVCLNKALLMAAATKAQLSRTSHGKYLS